MRSVVDAHHQSEQVIVADASRREQEWRESTTRMYERLDGLQVSREDRMRARA